MSFDLIDLRATAAMRQEDLRLATKHREEAGARVMSPESKRAYDGALTWETTCREAAEAARALVIQVSA